MRATDAQTIPQLVRAAARQFGQSIFLEEDTVHISFGEFEQRCTTAGRAMIASGVAPGDRVAVWAPNIHEWVIAALAAQCIGAVLVTLNTRYKGSEAAYILRASRARLLFSIGDFLGSNYPQMLSGEALPDLEETVVFRRGAGAHTPWDTLLQRAAQVDDAQLRERMENTGAGDTSDLLFTSGTTGAPKGVMCTHGQNLRAFSTFADIVGLQQGDRYLVINPFFHSYGYKAGILACLLRGVTLLPHLTFDARTVAERIAADKVSVLPGPPTLFQSLLALPDLADYDLSSLKRTTTGAAAIPVEMIHRMRAVLGFETVITAYGLTECCGLVTMCRADDEAETVATTSGRAIPGVEVRCVDTDNNEVSSGEPGEIVVRGFNVMSGYFENAQATAETIDAEGWLHTGDIGVLDEKGNLRITDRLKDMFITGGFNCYPAEIENTLAGHPGIAASAVIGIPDERLGEVAMAFIIPKRAGELNEEELIAWCRQHMANFKVPRRIAFVTEFPVNASGKVLKRELSKKVLQSTG
ncbi:MAG: FadD3 family acyl-CoA ligase [Halioglobus sp.]|nr:FadD3 family acyl-CoA ligase [Halioglobus sp.]